MSERPIDKTESELNPTGVTPVQYRVLVLPDDVDEQIGRILIPIDTQARDEAARDQGILVAVSERAFTGDPWEGSRKPHPGERVFFNKYAGSTFLYPKNSSTGKNYRLLNDEDIVAILEEKE